MRSWIEDRAGGERVLVQDAGREQRQPRENVTAGYSAGDITPDGALGWIDVRMRPARQLVYVSWAIIALGGVAYWGTHDVDFFSTLTVVAALSGLIYIFLWRQHKAVTNETAGVWQERYEAVTQRIAEPMARPTGPAVGVVADALSPDEALRRLKIELMYVLLRAVHTPASPRSGETETIPGVNVTLDDRLYRYLMYILRELGLVTGGMDPVSGRRAKWRCNYTSEAKAREAFRAVEGRLRYVNLDRIAELARNDE